MTKDQAIEKCARAMLKRRGLREENFRLGTLKFKLRPIAAEHHTLPQTQGESLVSQLGAGGGLVAPRLETHSRPPLSQRRAF